MIQGQLDDFTGEKLPLMEEEVKALLEAYERHRPLIKAFLAQARSREDEHLVTELMFCLQTAQSPARNARQTMDRLKGKGILFTANPEQVIECMEGVRFADKKAQYMFKARQKLHLIKEQLGMPPQQLREWLVESIDGMGMKLASHYMRNIGIGGLAILDVHVQNWMARNGMLKGEVGKLNTKQYLENERTYLKLAKQLGIPPEELDIAIWMLGNGSGEFYG